MRPLVSNLTPRTHGVLGVQYWDSVDFLCRRWQALCLGSGFILDASLLRLILNAIYPPSLSKICPGTPFTCSFPNCFVDFRFHSDRQSGSVEKPRLAGTSPFEPIHHHAVFLILVFECTRCGFSLAHVNTLSTIKRHAKACFLLTFVQICSRCGWTLGSFQTRRG